MTHSVHQPETDIDEQVVAVNLREGLYALPIAQVQEIVRVPDITRVPRPASDVQGIINLRGRVLPVVDLASRLGLGSVENTRHARVVVVQTGSDGVGLLVDGVSEVLRLRDDAVEPATNPAGGVGSGAAVLRGVARVDERLLLLLDLPSVLSAM